MPHKGIPNKKIRKVIAKSRINKLFQSAEENAFSGDLHLSNRYIEIARKISMKYLTPIPRQYKRRFCKHCYTYHLPNVNCRIRIHRGKTIIYCHNCKKYTRFPIK